jgi:hypothetical protein
MEFYIQKNSNLPIIKMQVVKDGKSSLDDFSSIIEDSVIYFSMKDISNGEMIIMNKKGGFVEKTKIDENAKTEYYVYYKFTKQETKKSGRYIGEFKLMNNNGVYVLPIRENLYINVL